MTTPAEPPPDLRAWFQSLPEWQAFLRAHPEVMDRVAVEDIVAFGVRHGVSSRMLGEIPPSGMMRGGANHREEFAAAGFNPRQRAMLETLAEHPLAGDPHRIRIWGHEAVTAFALFLRARYPKYVGSEYADTPAGREALFPIPVIDITRADWPDESFDVVLSGDVFEHVPDLDASLRECARVMRPGGRLIASFPFLSGGQTTEIRARLEPGGVRHLFPPEYHGNPVDPEGGSLVFQVPAWDILPRCRAAGFGRAAIQFWSSHRRGLVSADLTGVLFLDAWR